MTRLTRHHDKLLDELATIERVRAEVERSQGSAKILDRLEVRERAVTGAIRRVRSQLGLVCSILIAIGRSAAETITVA